MKLAAWQQQLVSKSVDCLRLGVQWGFVPFILYLGFRQGAEPLPNGQVVPLTLLSLLWG
ncbi:Mitochondrial import receptor subunit TOM7 -like protein [Toxocara canis]|uniref:Mitochondrial import receptor subunit TOM7 homolog n=1 Tax=Toxocara canis TaxID=6265 RepID=A0A0B2VFW0_TOXCA|nr:Mitochondrial import receptor subunit TOM7 -like protein [Toxocara canis]